MKSFGELLFETMDDTVRKVLGESASELICRLIERHVSLKREKVGEKFEALFTFLKKLFGSEGAQIIQNTSLKRLYLRLWREYEDIERYFSFLDELYEIKFELLFSSLEQDRSMCNCN